MEHEPDKEGEEGGHDGGVQVPGVLGVGLQRLVLDILTHPLHRLLAVCMVWGEGVENLIKRMDKTDVAVDVLTDVLDLQLCETRHELQRSQRHLHTALSSHKTTVRCLDCMLE